MLKFGKCLCLLLVICLFEEHSFAADICNRAFRIGLEIGFNVAKFVGTDTPRYDEHGLPANTRVGFAGGAFVDVPIGRTLSIRPELLYSMKGTSYKQGVEKVTYQMNYLEFPLLLKYTFNPPSNVKVHIFAGPAFAWRLNMKVMYQYENGIGELPFDKSELKSTDVSFVFGAGLGLRAGKGLVTLDGRYTLGLRSIDATTVNDPVESNVKNGTFSVLLGYGL